MLIHAQTIRSLIKAAMNLHALDGSAHLQITIADGEPVHIDGLALYKEYDFPFPEFTGGHTEYEIGPHMDENCSVELHSPRSIVERLSLSILYMLVDEPANKVFKLEIATTNKKTVITLLSAEGDILLVTTTDLLIGKMKV